MSMPEPNLLGELEAFRVQPPPTGSCRSILLKGASGSGKTHFALESSPGPVVVVYQDNNRMTLEKLMARRPDIHELHFDTWADFDDRFVTLARNRQLPVGTICIDTGDMLCGMMWQEIQGSKSRLTTPDFGTGFNRLSEAFTMLSGVCRPTKDHPGYHLIVNWHLYDVTNEQGALLRVTPRVLGQFKDHVEDLFDVVLLMDIDVAGQVETRNGRQEMVNHKVCFARTVPPSSHHTTKAPLEWPEKVYSYEELAALIKAETANT